MDNNKVIKTELISRYESRLVRIEDIEVPFEKITKETMYYGRDYYAAVSRSVIKDLAIEHQVALFLAADGSVMAIELQAIGTEEQVSYSIKKIVRTSIMLSSRFVVLVHNHPQNTSTSCSEMDKIAHSHSLKQLEKYDITLVDSLVITDTGRWSSVTAALTDNSRSNCLEATTAPGTIRGRGYQPAPFLMQSGQSRKEKLTKDLRYSFEKLLKKTIAIFFLVMLVAEGNYITFQENFTFDHILSQFIQKPILGPLFIVFIFLCLAVLDNIFDLITLSFQKFSKEETEIQKLEAICRFQNECLSTATDYIFENSETKEKGLLILNSLQSHSMMMEKSWYQNRSLIEIEKEIRLLKKNMNI